MTKYWIGPVLAAAMVVAPTFAQSGSQTQHDHAAATSEQKTGMMGQDHQQMMADMKVADDRLRNLLSQVEAADGDEKLKAIAALLAQLVTDRVKMHHHMMEMHERMMSHK